MIKLSYTGNEKYKLSPRAYYLYYMLKIREEKVGSALVFGSAIDDGLNALLLKKGDPKKIFENSFTITDLNGLKVDIRTSPLVKWFKSDLDESLFTEEDKELATKYNPSWVTMRRKGLTILDAYETQVLPALTEILSVQEYFSIKNKTGDVIHGFIDLVARFSPTDKMLEDNPELGIFKDKIIIFDNKTSGTGKAPFTIAESGQLATYTAHPSTKYHADAEGYIVIPKKFRKQKEPLVNIKVEIGLVSEETVDRQFKEYENTLKGIKYGVFPCNTQNCENSPFGCPYYNYCKSGSMEGLIKIKE